MAEDGLQHSYSDSDSIGTHSILAKVAAVVLAVFSVGLIVDPFNDFYQKAFEKRTPKLDDIAFIYITLGSYLIINTMFIICHVVLGDRIPKRLSLMFSSVGVLFHIIAASLIIHNWQKVLGSLIWTYNNENYPSKQYRDMLISGGVFTFLTAGALVGDVYVTIKY